MLHPEDFKALLVHLRINRGLSFREIADLVTIRNGDIPIETCHGEYSGASKSTIERYVR
jgi:hypothetical protein